MMVSLVHELLPLGGRPALERAMKLPMSFGVRFVLAPGDKPRVVVILGEAHLKLSEASDVGKQVVSKFELRGVETFQRKDVFLGSALGWLIHAPRILLRAVSLGSVKDSTIVDAKKLGEGTTYELERTEKVPLPLHVASVYLTVLFSTLYAYFILNLIGISPMWLHAITLFMQVHMLFMIPAYLMRKQSWAWLIHPAIGLVATRDELMADGTVKMLKEHPEPSAAVVVMGRAHVAGFEKLLVEKHGFTRTEL